MYFMLFAYSLETSIYFVSRFYVNVIPSPQAEEELDPKATYLVVVPGFEGHHEVFTTACERLKVQAVAYQYGPELTNASVPEMAANLMQVHISSSTIIYIFLFSFFFIFSFLSRS